jgi:dihydroorotate dehydrogenase electron transfer subunit
MIVNSSVSQVLSRVISTTEVMPGVYLIWLESPRIAPIARPGQFVMVCCGEDTLLRRPFSIHQVNNNGIALLYAVLPNGKGTQWLSQRQVNDKIDLLGPLGNGYSIAPASHNILLVAGGIGIAPLCFLARVAMENEYEVTMLMGASTVAQLCPRHLIPSEMRCITTTDDGSKGTKGFITYLLSSYAERADQIFACGPSPMYRAMAKMPELKGKSVQISLEIRMGCGLGVCYGCTVKTKQGLKQVCQDGPVFELSDILWDEFLDI